MKYLKLILLGITLTAVFISCSEELDSVVQPESEQPESVILNKSAGSDVNSSNYVSYNLLDNYPQWYSYPNRYPNLEPVWLGWQTWLQSTTLDGQQCYQMNGTIYFNFPEAVRISVLVYNYNPTTRVVLATNAPGGYAETQGTGEFTWLTAEANAGKTMTYCSIFTVNPMRYWVRIKELRVWYKSNNEAPLADAGSYEDFTCVIENQTITLDGSGSTDPDGDPLTYSWTGAFGTAEGVSPTVVLPVGMHTVTLTVSDGQATSTDEVIINVLGDTEAPMLSAPADLNLYANTSGGYSGDIGTAAAEDGCDSNPVVTNNAPALFPLGTTIVTYTATDASGNTSTATQAVTVNRFPVTLDIKPGENKNSINTKNKGVIPVAVLSDANFDATTLEVSSLRFGPASASESHGKGHFEDANGDGIVDLVLHFDTQATGLSKGDTEACITGTTKSGIPIEGCDLVSIK